MFPSVDSATLQELETFQGRWDSFVHFGTIAVGVAIALLGPVLSKYASRVEARIAEIKEAEAADKIRNLTEQNGRISAAVTNRSELFTPESEAILLERFSALPPKSVSVETVSTDRESAEFTQLMNGILAQSGCLASGGVTIVMENSPTLPAGGHGVEIIAKKSPPEPVAQALYDALTEAGIPKVKFSSPERLARVPKFVQVDAPGVLLRILPR